MRRVPGCSQSAGASTASKSVVQACSESPPQGRGSHSTATCTSTAALPASGQRPQAEPASGLRLPMGALTSADQNTGTNIDKERPTGPQGRFRPPCSRPAPPPPPPRRSGLDMGAKTPSLPTATGAAATSCLVLGGGVGEGEPPARARNIGFGRGATTPSLPTDTAPAGLNLDKY